jgi:hypothetical protein
MQVSISNAQTPSQLYGASTDVAGGFGKGAAGLGAGGDLSLGQNSGIWQGTLTVGFGGGGFGGAGIYETSTVTPLGLY